jgi:hypothetical protein
VKLKERDSLFAEVKKLQAAGKLMEAIAAAEKMLVIEREVFGPVHSEVADSLSILAKMHEEQEDFTSARTARQTLLEVQKKLYGEKDWRVADAELELEHVNLLAQLDRAQRPPPRSPSKSHGRSVAGGGPGCHGEEAPRRTAEKNLARGRGLSAVRDLP